MPLELFVIIRITREGHKQGTAHCRSMEDLFTLLRDVQRQIRMDESAITEIRAKTSEVLQALQLDREKLEQEQAREAENAKALAATRAQATAQALLDDIASQHVQREIGQIHTTIQDWFSRKLYSGSLLQLVPPFGASVATCESCEQKFAASVSRLAEGLAVAKKMVAERDSLARQAAELKEKVSELRQRQSQQPVQQRRQCFWRDKACVSNRFGSSFGTAAATDRTVESAACPQPGAVLPYLEQDHCCVVYPDAVGQPEVATPNFGWKVHPNSNGTAPIEIASATAPRKRTIFRT